MRQMTHMTRIACLVTAALLLGGCDETVGRVLRLRIDRGCVSTADIGILDLSIQEPEVASPDRRLTIDGASFFGSDGIADMVLLLPESATSVSLAVTARRTSSEELGAARLTDAALFGRDETRLVTLANATCPASDLGPVSDLLAPSDDLATETGDLVGASDLADPDAPMVTSITVLGRLGEPYEGEGSDAPTPAHGIALLVRGTHLGSLTELTSTDTSVTLGALSVSADGTYAAAAIGLAPVPERGEGEDYTVPITAGTQTFDVDVHALGEWFGDTDQVVVSSAVRRYSGINASAFDLTGPGRLYLWVGGGATFAGATFSNGGSPGCGTLCNFVTNGNGHGFAGSNEASGSGAGYGETGNKAEGNAGALGGAAYGGPLVFGLPGGSGGGSGSATSIQGGRGGGVLRVSATRIAIDGGLFANGESPEATTSEGGAGGGSGGTILLSALFDVTGTLVQARGGDGGAGATYRGGNGANGRIRIDAGTDADLDSAIPAIGSYGAVLSGQLETVLLGSITMLPVACGFSTFHIEVNGTLMSASTTCSGGPVLQQVTLTSPLPAGELLQICTVLEGEPGAPATAYTGLDAEDRMCRPFVVVE